MKKRIKVKANKKTVNPDVIVTVDSSSLDSAIKKASELHDLILKIKDMLRSLGC